MSDHYPIVGVFGMKDRYSNKVSAVYIWVNDHEKIDKLGIKW